MGRLRKLVVSGFLMGAVYSAEATVPNFATWTGYESLASSFLLSGTLHRVTQLNTMLDTFCKGKSVNGNQKVMLGYEFPLVYLAASLPDDTSYLKSLLDNQGTVNRSETPMGNTPMHAAAINSAACLQILVDDRRYDVNEYNHEGETPLYLAMKAGNTEAVDILLNAATIRVNTVDFKKRTMLHIAVMQGQPEVVKQVLALKDSKDLENTLNKRSEDDEETWDEGSVKDIVDHLVEQIDALGKSALDYIFNVQDPDTRNAILDNMAGVIGSEAGQVSFVVTDQKKAKMTDAANKVDELATGIKTAGLNDEEAVQEELNGITGVKDALSGAITGLSAYATSTADNVTALRTVNENKKIILTAIENLRALLDNEPKNNYNVTDPIDITLYNIQEALKDL